MPNQQEQTETKLSVPAATTPKKELQIMMNEDNLQALKEQDPFMYRSIPAVHKAELLFEDVDHSVAAAASTHQQLSQPQTGSSEDCPDLTSSFTSSLTSSFTSSLSSFMVSRKSAEYHSFALMEDLLLDDDDFFNMECTVNTRVTISRKSRISTECHDSLLMEGDLLNDEEFMSFDDEAFEDLFYSQ